MGNSFSGLPGSHLYETQMPNKRDPNKRQLRAWMYQEDIEFLRGKAESLGIPLSELLIKLSSLLKEENRSNKL